MRCRSSYSERRKWDAEEAARIMDRLDGSTLKRKQREMVAVARTDFYVRQGMYEQAIPEAERLVRTCKSIKRKPRYNFLLSQLYVKENQDGAAKLALKKATRFNFNYEMVFNARIGMLLSGRRCGRRKEIEENVAGFPERGISGSDLLCFGQYRK
ncbi:MAG: hypothetical protein ACLUOS_06440 [Odoribacter splanchnicus]